MCGGAGGRECRVSVLGMSLFFFFVAISTTKKLLISGAKLKTLENTKSGANPPKLWNGGLYMVLYRADTVSKGSCPIFFLSKTFFDRFAPVLPIKLYMYIRVTSIVRPTEYSTSWAVPQTHKI